MPVEASVSTNSQPPGVLPKNLRFIVLGWALVIVIVISHFSTRKGKSISETPKTVGPSQRQLSTFQQGLERQRKEAEEAMRRAEDARRAEELRKLVPAAPASQGSRERDPIQEQRRARAAAAPFASSVVIRQPEKVDKITVDRVSQVAYTPPAVEKAEVTASAEDSAEKSKESGKLLPATEGELHRLYEGTMVETILANRLEGSFTGPVTCVVSKSVASKDESVVLIPIGSRFLGSATRVTAENQTRLAVTFKRLILPNGYSVDLESAPGLDRLGETGLKDKVNNHRIRTFSIAGAMGLLGGLALYGRADNPYASGVARGMGNAGTSALGRYLNAVPTITIREGHSVTVYLPADLLLPEYRP